MYDDYFGLKQPPFKITPDTSLFYSGGDRGAILEALIYAILKGEGIVKVVGEVGSGKTMLCRMLETELPGNVEVVYLANPSLSPENILHAIAFELGLPIQSDSSRLQVMNQLQQYLLQRHASARQVVVFVEEAQSMPVATLEEIRLLSNLETQQHKLLQIVLFGQPELDQMIARPEIRQLKERITYSFLLKPFKFNDIKDYINARLRACGHRSGEIFSNSAVKAIARYSRGLVRRINILADKSLLAAYAANHHQVATRHVRQAARDSEFIARNRSWFWASAMVICLLMATGITGYRQLVGSNQVPQPPVMVDEEEVPDQGESGAKTATTEAFKEIQGDPAGPPSQLMGASQLLEGYVIGTINAVEPGLLSGNGDDAESAGVSLDLVLADSVNGDDWIRDAPIFQVSERELRLMKKQLQLLPPEMAYEGSSSSEENTCRLCWSIVYRPMIDYENL